MTRTTLIHFVASISIATLAHPCQALKRKYPTRRFVTQVSTQDRGRGYVPANSPSASARQNATNTPSTPPFQPLATCRNAQHYRSHRSPGETQISFSQEHRLPNHIPGTRIATEEAALRQWRPCMRPRTCLPWKSRQPLAGLSEHQDLNICHFLRFNSTIQKDYAIIHSSVWGMKRNPSEPTQAKFKGASETQVRTCSTRRLAIHFATRRLTVRLRIPNPRSQGRG